MGGAGPRGQGALGGGVVCPGWWSPAVPCEGPCWDRRGSQWRAKWAGASEQGLRGAFTKGVPTPGCEAVWGMEPEQGEKDVHRRDGDGLAQGARTQTGCGDPTWGLNNE